MTFTPSLGSLSSADAGTPSRLAPFHVKRVSASTVELTAHDADIVFFPGQFVQCWPHQHAADLPQRHPERAAYFRIVEAIADEGHTTLYRGELQHGVPTVGKKIGQHIAPWLYLLFRQQFSLSSSVLLWFLADQPQAPSPAALAPPELPLVPLELFPGLHYVGLPSYQFDAAGRGVRSYRTDVAPEPPIQRCLTALMEKAAAVAILDMAEVGGWHSQMPGLAVQVVGDPGTLLSRPLLQDSHFPLPLESVTDALLTDSPENTFSKLPTRPTGRAVLYHGATWKDQPRVIQGYQCGWVLQMLSILPPGAVIVLLVPGLDVVEAQLDFWRRLQGLARQKQICLVLLSNTPEELLTPAPTLADRLALLAHYLDQALLVLNTQDVIYWGRLTDRQRISWLLHTPSHALLTPASPAAFSTLTPSHPPAADPTPPTPLPDDDPPLQRLDPPAAPIPEDLPPIVADAPPEPVPFPPTALEPQAPPFPEESPPLAFSPDPPLPSHEPLPEPYPSAVLPHDASPTTPADLTAGLDVFEDDLIPLPPPSPPQDAWDQPHPQPEQPIPEPYSPIPTPDPYTEAAYTPQAPPPPWQDRMVADPWWQMMGLYARGFPLRFNPFAPPPEMAPEPYRQPSQPEPPFPVPAPPVEVAQTAPTEVDPLPQPDPQPLTPAPVFQDPPPADHPTEPADTEPSASPAPWLDFAFEATPEDPLAVSHNGAANGHSPYAESPPTTFLDAADSSAFPPPHPPAPPTLAPGAQVWHPQYQTGTLLDMIPLGDRQVLRVMFQPPVGLRLLDARSSGLQVLGPPAPQAQ